MMSRPLIAAALAAVFLSSGTSAAAPCRDRESAIAVLGVQYKERLVAHGISMSGHLVELFISSQRTATGNTWTITATNPRTKILCLISNGAVWLDVVSVDVKK